MRNILLLAPVVALLAASPARAEAPAETVHYPRELAAYLGLYGGGNIPLRTWDLGNHDRISLVQPSASGLVGARLGFQVLPRLALEVEFALLPMTSSTGDSNTVVTANFDAVIHLWAGRFSPVVEAGFGLYSVASGDLGSDTDARLHLGVGFREMVTNWLALRITVRDAISDGMDSGGAHNLEFTAGVDFFAWRQREAPPDRDGDGVADAEDACPDLAGAKEARGCPDADHDGIADDKDRCPRQSGTAATSGCPDQDGDGVADLDDRCPKEPGPAKTKGCPDGDGDGVPDVDDRCPKQAGSAKTKGCPDTDGDGVVDLDDRCPKEPGLIALKGCPDKDGDGIPDIDDKCPEVRGVKEQQGCLPDVVTKKFSGAMKGITFATGSAKILKPSFKILDEAISVMKDYPILKLAIGGHTDNVGQAQKNQKLSQARADAVRDYLASKGIAESRVRAAGFGDTKPVQDNKTEKGRAANRRIEFKVTAE